jgi:hypothetical protein
MDMKDLRELLEFLWVVIISATVLALVIGG